MLDCELYFESHWSRPWFSCLTVHQNPLEGLLKSRLLGSPPDILIQPVQGGAWEVAFLTNSRWCWCRQFRNHALRITGLDQSHNSKICRSFFLSNHPARVFPCTTEISVRSDNILHPLGTFSISSTWWLPWNRIASLSQELREDCGNSDQISCLCFSPAILPVSVFKLLDYWLLHCLLPFICLIYRHVSQKKALLTKV